MSAPLPHRRGAVPDLLGTYGDGGNGLILARRAEWRGIDVELVQAASDAPLPEADMYCLGGGEDGPQVRAARSLIDDGMLAAPGTAAPSCWRCAPATKSWAPLSRADGARMRAWAARATRSRVPGPAPWARLSPSWSALH